MTDKTVLTAAQLPAAISEAEAAERGYVARLSDAEPNLHTLIFENADGTRTLRLFDHPVKYEENGAVKDISLDIETTTGGFASAQSPINVSFPLILSNGIALAYEDVDVSMTPLPSSAPPLGSITTVNMTGTLSEDNRTVSYDYDPDTVFEYQLTYAGFKEDIVVKEYTGQTEYAFLLHTGGLTLTEAGGSHFLTDEKGEIRATLGDVIILTADGCNNALGSMTYETVKANDTYLLTIHVDAAYLADENTAYPIRIDPTLEINYEGSGAAAIEDATVISQSVYPYPEYNSSYLFVGRHATFGITRTLMKFPGLDLDMIGTASQIISARLEVSHISYAANAASVSVSCHAFGGAWEVETVSWANTSSAAIYPTPSDSKSIFPGNGDDEITGNTDRYSFNLTSIVQMWKDGTASPSKGIVLKASSSVENGTASAYASLASYNRPADRPSFTMVYSNPYNSSTSDTSFYTNSILGPQSFTINSGTESHTLTFPIYNDDNLQLRANCYGYALKMACESTIENAGYPYPYFDVNGDLQFDYYCYGQQPGEFGDKSSLNEFANGTSNYDKTISLYRHFGITIDHVMNMIELDFQRLGYEIVSTAKYQTASEISSGGLTNKRLVLLVVGNGDYHFYLQHYNNMWSHKRGCLAAQSTCIGNCNTTTYLTNQTILDHCQEGGYNADYIFFYIDKPAPIDYFHGDGMEQTCVDYTPLDQRDMAGWYNRQIDQSKSAFSSGTMISGTIDYIGDDDNYAFDLSVTRQYTFVVTTKKDGSQYSHPICVEITDSSGQTISSGVYSGNETFTATLSAGQIYHMCISSNESQALFEHWREYSVIIM